MKKKFFFIIFIIFIFLVFDNIITEYFKLKHFPYLNNKNISDIDCIVVLTGAKGRIAKGLSFIKNKNIKLLIISGANPISTKKEILKNFTKYQDFFKKVQIENLSKNTIENAIETKKIILNKNLKNILIVTSISHIKRAYFIFNKVFNKTVVKIHFLPVNENITLTKIIKEKIKLLFDIIILYFKGF